MTEEKKISEYLDKVAPPKYKGLMMGGWFVATALGNKLVGEIGKIWGEMQLWMVWSVLIVCCLVAGFCKRCLPWISF